MARVTLNLVGSMQSKRIIWLAAGVGAWLGSYVPELWGAGEFSGASVVCSLVGAILGIWAAFKLTY